MLAPNASDAARAMAYRSAEVRREKALDRRIESLAADWPKLTDRQIARLRTIVSSGGAR